MRWRPAHRPRDGDHPHGLGCRSNDTGGGSPHDRREIGHPQQRRAARHRQPRARPPDGCADDPARRDHRVRGPSVGEDLHRQGVPGPRGRLRGQGLPEIRGSGDHLPGGQRDRQPLRRGAGRPRCRPWRRRRHHAAQLARTGAAHAGGGQVRRDLRHAELPPARRRAQAQPGTAVRQGRRRRPRLRRSDQGKRRRHRRAGDARRVQAPRRDRADEQPGHRRGRAGQGQGVLHLHVGHHRHAEGQRHDPLPVAAGAGRLRRPRDAAQQQRHPVLLPAALPQQRADGRAVGGAQLAGRRWRSASRSRRRSSGTTSSATTPPRSSTSARSAPICSTSRPRTPTASTRCG